MADDPTSIVIDQFYPHPAHRVWRALTTPELMARWLLDTEGFAPVPGTRFTMRDPHPWTVTWDRTGRAPAPGSC